MRKDLINMEYWREAHLLPLLCPTDAFYVKYARKIRDKIRKADFERKLSPDDMTEIALTLTYYLEDVVSGLGVWRSFVLEHQRMYGCFLPFYETREDNYYIDEVNEADVCFLIWMTFQKRNNGMIVNPENSYMQKLAHEIFLTFDEDFEQLPINSELLEAMQKPVLYKDFYNLKTLMVQVCCMSYLFYYFTAQHRSRVLNFVKHIVGEGQPLSVIEYMVESFLGVYEKTGPLSLKPQVWISRMLEQWGMKEEEEAVSQMEAKELQPYLIVECDEQKLLLEDWQQQRFELELADMLQVDPKMVARQKVMLGSIVQYKGKWYPNGGVSWLSGDAKFTKFKEQKLRIRTQNEQITQKVMELNGQSPFLFFEDYNTMKLWMDEHLKEETQASSILNDGEKHDEEKNIVVFVSPETGLLVLPGGACCIKHKDNPYYLPAEAGAYAVRVLFDPHFSSSEMVRCLVQENLLPDAALYSEISEERGKQLLQDNLDFLLRTIRSDF